MIGGHDPRYRSRLSVLQRVGLGHGLLRQTNVVVIVGAGKSALIGHAQGREVEGLGRLQFTGPATMLHGILMLADSTAEHRQGQVSERVVGVLPQQLPQLRDRLLVLAVIFEFVRLVVQRREI